MRNRIGFSSLLFAALVGVMCAVWLHPVTAGQAGAKAYKGTITLKRTNAAPDNNMNESAAFTNVVLANTSDTADKSSWMNTNPPTVTVAVNNVNTDNPTISIPSRTVKADRIAITLMVAKSKKTFSLTIGPIKQIPATITAGGQKVNDFWDIQGQTASGLDLPADASHLKGSITVTETNHAKVELTWDLQLM
jgi:hypothetical protein